MDHKQQLKARIPVSSGRGYQGKQGSLFKTRALPIRQSSPTSGCCACAPARAGGFTVFWFLAVVVFVATFAGVITLQYQATQTAELAAAPADRGTPVPAADTPQSDQADKQPVGQEGKPGGGTGKKTLLARFLDHKAIRWLTSTVHTEAKTEEQPHDWTEDLYARLDTLEAPSAGHRDVVSADADVNQQRDDHEDRLGRSESNPEADDQTQENAMPKGNLAISGRVLTQDGEPLIGIALVASGTSFLAGKLPSGAGALGTVSGAGGHYIFRGLPDGEYNIRTVPSGSYATTQRAVRAGVDFADLVLVSTTMAGVSGSVVSTQGVPLAGVRVQPLIGRSGSAVTDSAGRYHLALTLNDTTGSVPVRFSASGHRAQQYALGSGDLEHGGTATLDAVLEPVESVAVVNGRIMNTEGRPVPGEVLRLYSHQLKNGYQAVSSAEGEFVIPGVATASDYKLFIHPQGPYRDYEAQNLKVGDSGLRTDIVLESLALNNRLSGIMIDKLGNPVPNFSLTLVNRDNSSFPPQRVTGDGYGRFNVVGIPAGELVFESRSMPLLNISNVKLVPGEETRVRLVLDIGQYRIEGMVVDAEDNPVPASSVSLRWSAVNDSLRSWSTRRTAADSQGRFLFSGLGPGVHTVQIDAPGYIRSQLSHDVPEQGENIVMKLNREPSRLALAE